MRLPAASLFGTRTNAAGSRMSLKLRSNKVSSIDCRRGSMPTDFRLHSTDAPLYRPRLPFGAGARREPPHLSARTFVRRGAQRIHQPAAAAGSPFKRSEE